MPKHDIIVEGEHFYGDNAMFIIAAVSKALKNNNLVEEAKAFSVEAMNQQSYDDLWNFCRETVEVV